MICILPKLAKKMACSAAFSAARYKIKSTFFQALNAIVVEHIQKLSVKTWNGYQLIAVDGSTVSMPPSQSIKSFFGIFSVTNKGTKTCMAQALMCYDVLSNYILASVIDKMSTSEKGLLRMLLPKMKVTKAIFYFGQRFWSLQYVQNVSKPATQILYPAYFTALCICKRRYSIG